jgi:predicted nucleotidyltransferase
LRLSSQPPPMITDPRTNPLDVLIARLGLTLPAIARARDQARLAKEAMGAAVADVVSQEDASVVVFGSLARDELTSRSDTDWTLLVDGQASSTHFDTVREVGRRLNVVRIGAPGREGTFGSFAFSHDLLHRIGGANDSNANLTQRMLLVLESSALGPDAAYRRVLRGVLSRYAVDDAGLETRSEKVPRFLLNDVARYWRTIAVDYAYKRRERGSEGWALRTLKLQTSRKLIYASGLLACFSCALEPSITQSAEPSRELIEHLLRLAAQTPLERMASILLALDHAEPARTLLLEYDAFLQLLDSEEDRGYLEQLSPDASQDDVRYRRAREIGDGFQAALDHIFFDDGSPIPHLTRKYGVF